jgi:hypothetical protein
MLHDVQSFMAGTSTIDGVETKKHITANNNKSIIINSTVFMNLLYTSLQSKSANELTSKLNVSLPSTNLRNDPFFSKEDYTLMDPSDDEEEQDDNDDNDCEIDEQNAKIQDLMNEMDHELRQKSSTSRTWDTMDHVDTVTDDIAHNTHVLSNLFKSLDASGGQPGPIRNILHEMGSIVPIVISDDDNIGDT